MTCRNPAGVELGRSAGSSFRIALSVSTAESPAKGRCPEESSCNTRPRLNKSDRASIVSPRTCSGERYPTVPTITPTSDMTSARGERIRRDAKQLGEPEVEDLHAAVARDHHVFWLEIAVDVAGLMGGSKCLGDLRAHFDNFPRSQRAIEEPLSQGGS